MKSPSPHWRERRASRHLVVQRNQVRDYLDVVALADRLGIHDGANVLRHLDEFYLDRSGEDDSVVTAWVQRTAEPNSRDSEVTRQLDRHMGLLPRLQDWESVTTMCHTLPARFCKEATHDTDVRNVQADPADRR